MMKKIFLLLAICFCACKKKEIYPATTSTKTEVQSFRLVNGAGANVTSTVNIDSKLALITVFTTPGTPSESLFPSSVISEGAIIEPVMGVYTDFTKPVQYTVIAGNRQDRKVWTVKVTSQ